jgi:hypothetical protein
VRANTRPSALSKNASRIMIGLLDHPGVDMIRPEPKRERSPRRSVTSRRAADATADGVR